MSERNLLWQRPASGTQVTLATCNEANMIRTISILLALSLIGDTLVDIAGLPVPGSIVGLLVLTGCFALRGGPDRETCRLFDTLSPVFPLFFVPAAVAVVVNGDLLARAWLHVAVAITLSTAATILVTGLAAQSLLVAFRKVRTS